MKVLISPETGTPKPPPWAGKNIICPKCNTAFELESSDVPVTFSGLQPNDYYFECLRPECKGAMSIRISGR